MHVIPERLCDLAAQCLAASQQIADGWGEGGASLELDSGAAGNTQGGFDAMGAHRAAASAAATAVGRLVSVLEQDTDDLYLCAFGFSCADEIAAAQVETTWHDVVLGV